MIGKVLILSGLSLMNFATLLAIFRKPFMVKLHMIGASDTTGGILVLIGLMLSGFQPMKIAISLVFLLLWNPIIAHTIAKTHLERMKR